MRRALNPATVPDSPYYAQEIEVIDASQLVFVSGQVGIDPAGRTVDGIAGQARQAVANLNAVLAPDAIAKLTINLTDAEHVEQFMAAAGPKRAAHERRLVQPNAWRPAGRATSGCRRRSRRGCGRARWPWSGGRGRKVQPSRLHRTRSAAQLPEIWR